MSQIVLATRNLGKVAEFERLVSAVQRQENLEPIKVLGLTDFPEMPDVEETGTTFAENSLLKSRAVCEYTKLPAIADDSGLCIDFLNGDPGIFSARWAGRHGDDAANNAKVLQQLSKVPSESRSAYFTCVVTLVFPKGHRNEKVEIIESGTLHGQVAFEPRGNAGFGYDSIFIPAGYELTLGEFAPGAKDEISHRGQAMRKIAPQIATLI
jgi:XTP/dITP diphosphohydrolase